MNQLQIHGMCSLSLLNAAQKQTKAENESRTRCDLHLLSKVQYSFFLNLKERAN